LEKKKRGKTGDHRKVADQKKGGSGPLFQKKKKDPESFPPEQNAEQKIHQNQQVRGDPSRVRR